MEHKEKKHLHNKPTDYNFALRYLGKKIDKQQKYYVTRLCNFHIVAIGHSVDNLRNYDLYA